MVNSILFWHLWTGAITWIKFSHSLCCSESKLCMRQRCNGQVYSPLPTSLQPHPGHLQVTNAGPHHQQGQGQRSTCEAVPCVLGNWSIEAAFAPLRSAVRLWHSWAQVYKAAHPGPLTKVTVLGHKAPAIKFKSLPERSAWSLLRRQADTCQRPRTLR